MLRLLQGHLIGHVKDVGVGSKVNDPCTRIYLTSAAQPWHVDGADLVGEQRTAQQLEPPACCMPALPALSDERRLLLLPGLLCLKTAKSGGLSSWSSSVTIHNELLKRDPEIVRTLVRRYGSAGSACTHAWRRDAVAHACACWACSCSVLCMCRLAPGTWTARTKSPMASSATLCCQSFTTIRSALLTDRRHAHGAAARMRCCITRLTPPMLPLPLQGFLTTTFNDSYYQAAQRHAEVPRLTAAQLDALEAYRQAAASPAVRIDYQLAPGDMQLLNNHTTVHTRSAFDDYEVRVAVQARRTAQFWPCMQCAQTLLLLRSASMSACVVS